MPIYDNDGTASREIGKLYDHNGSVNTQIGYVYDNNGSANSLIYNANTTGIIWNNGAGNLVGSAWFKLLYQQYTNTDGLSLNAGSPIKWPSVWGGTSWGTALIMNQAVSLVSGQKITATVGTFNVNVQDTNVRQYSAYVYIVLFSSMPTSLEFDVQAMVQKYQNVTITGTTIWMPTTSGTVYGATKTLTVGTSGTFYPAIVVAGYDSNPKNVTVNNWAIIE